MQSYSGWMDLGNCRACSGMNLFGAPESKAPAPEDSKKATSSSGKKAAPASSTRRRFVPRKPEEIKVIVDNWSQYIHPRALEFFPNIEAIRKVLSEILSELDRASEDPVLGADDKCVVWHGSIAQHENENQAVVRIMKPGDTMESVTYVNRVLPFIFADDESFEELMELPKEPFTMCCGNQLCINLCHISFHKKAQKAAAPPPPAPAPAVEAPAPAAPAPAAAAPSEPVEAAPAAPAAAESAPAPAEPAAAPAEEAPAAAEAA